MAKRGLFILKQWYESKRRRLDCEVRAVKEHYPQFKLEKLNNGNLAWSGYLQTKKCEDTYGRRYNVLIVYPPSFPSEPPSSYVGGISGKEGTPHQFSDGKLCLFDPDDPNQWSPTCTAVVVITWTSAWLHAYEVWKKTGHWPGRSV
jgi:ubiquitin-protein ligase